MNSLEKSANLAGRILIAAIFLIAGRQELVDRAALVRLLYPGGAPASGEAQSTRGLRSKVDLLKREEILAALSRNGGNRSRAGASLQARYTMLFRRRPSSRPSRRKPLSWISCQSFRMLALPVAVGSWL